MCKYLEVGRNRMKVNEDSISSVTLDDPGKAGISRALPVPIPLLHPKMRAGSAQPAADQEHGRFCSLGSPWRVSFEGAPRNVLCWSCFSYTVLGVTKRYAKSHCWLVGNVEGKLPVSISLHPPPCY